MGRAPLQYCLSVPGTISTYVLTVCGPAGEHDRSKPLFFVDMTKFVNGSVNDWILVVGLVDRR
jgi:hypothetical protein